MRDIEHPVKGWHPPTFPEPLQLCGNYCRLSPLGLQDAPEIFAALAKDKSGETWRYMPVGPFADIDDLGHFFNKVCQQPDPMFFSITDLDTGQTGGFASYLRITPAQGCIEVGYIYLSPQLQKTRAATEAMYLMMKNAFDLGYRRYEWKCNAANQASMAAAQRLGFSFEGIFRQAMVVKGRNRDTAWFSILDQEWPAIEARFQKWLQASNFDSKNRQIRSL